MGKQHTADTCFETARWRSLVKIAALMNFGEGMERLERWLLAMGLKKVSFLLKVLKVLLKNIYPDVEYFSFLYIFIFLLMFLFFLSVCWFYDYMLKNWNFLNYFRNLYNIIFLWINSIIWKRKNIFDVKVLNYFDNFIYHINKW